ncbi:PIG-L deacetylase family protein [Ktedonospora formicarum]|uniref:Mycothiol S-conjugate amidase n=1 Tax=Ktedonospora formicarum TaxID=2778364 RepID=A0A8J3MX47_9CHLR|nr:PIG-L family deacetylase [Ktedonospora formicarum]GHO48200.1 mycothiol S-conjugate amidase [Ktedonospora formicarum]
MVAPLKLMCVLAHPDDESIALGGTLAKYAAEGVEISLVVATRGERGWFFDWSEYPGEAALGRMRERELRAACDVLGIKRLDFLNYIDGDLDQANGREVVAQVATLIREVRPDVVVSFGPDGLYGHPDHIAISQFTTAAVLCAADASSPCGATLAPHRVAKLYYRVSTEDWFATYVPIFGDMIMHIDGQERTSLSWVKWAVTTRLDTSDYWHESWDAVRCHRTQIPRLDSLPPIPVEVHKRLWGPQEFYRAMSLVNSGRREEHDLFEGLRPVGSMPTVTLPSLQII